MMSQIQIFIEMKQMKLIFVFSFFFHSNIHSDEMYIHIYTIPIVVIVRMYRWTSDIWTNNPAAISLMSVSICPNSICQLNGTFSKCQLLGKYQYQWTFNFHYVIFCIVFPSITLCYLQYILFGVA